MDKIHEFLEMLRGIEGRLRVTEKIATEFAAFYNQMLEV